MIKKHAKDLIIFLTIAIVITVAIVCMDIKTVDEYYTPTENDVTTNQDSTEQVQKKYVYISIDCINLKNAIQNGAKVKPELLQYVPENGIILQKQQVELQEGDTVFSILQRATKANKIALDYEYTPGFNSYYIGSIAHLAERDCGDSSGWMYLVNDENIHVGASRCNVNEGDVINWRYTITGKDVGGSK